MRNPVIDNLRGICAAGVIAIHTGGMFALQATQPNALLYVFLEVLSRYSVPAFFFISGYGLFKNYGFGTAFSCRAFLQKRLGSVALPYFTWSCLYSLYFAFLIPAYAPWRPSEFLFLLFYGLACYHLYFMVILLWFYCSFPLWRKLFSLLSRCGIRTGFFALLTAQLAFNYWTCHPGFTAASLPAALQNFFIYRLNYLPLHYLFIFMLGGLAARYQQNCCAFLQKNYQLITAFYTSALILLSAACFYCYYYQNYTLLNLANTFHQLSWQGFFYTITAIIFFSALLAKLKPKSLAVRTISLLADHSLLIYLVHPFFIDLINRFCQSHKIIITNISVMIIYFLLLILSLLTASLLRKAGKYLPRVYYCLTSKRP
jgi:surface polysaccharide O-acyltransferase-like enzyme